MAAKPKKMAKGGVAKVKKPKKDKMMMDPMMATGMAAPVPGAKTKVMKKGGKV